MSTESTPHLAFTGASTPAPGQSTPSTPRDKFSVTIKPGAPEANVVDGDTLIISIPRTGTLRPSKSGKTIIVATTGGFIRHVGDFNGHPIKISLTAYIQPATVSACEDDVQVPDDFRFQITKGVITAAISKKAFAIAVPVGRPRSSNSGAMTLLGPAGGNITTDLQVNGEQVIVNLTIGY